MNCKIHHLESASQLKNTKLKVTPGRLGLLDIFKHSKKPLAAKDIAKKFKAYGKIDLATLYRNLGSLEKLGLVKKLRLSDKENYYEIASRHHHHIICKVCRKIEDLEGCAAQNFISKKFLSKIGFASVLEHSLEFFGQCQKCAKKS